MPWIIRAPSISAIVPLAGIPRVSIGMNLHWASALLADSGPATPSIAPWPKRDGSLATFFSTMYELNEAIDGPVPGRTPKKAPSAVPLRIGAMDCLHVLQRRVEASHLGGEDHTLLRIAEVADDLPHRKHPHGDDHKTDPVRQLVKPEAETLDARNRRRSPRCRTADPVPPSPATSACRPGRAPPR